MISGFEAASRNPTLGEVAADLIELFRQVRPDRGKTADNDDGDQRGDQPVLDRGRTILIRKKHLESLHIASPG